MTKSDITKRPKRKTADILHTIAKAGLSCIPSASDLFSLIVTPSLEKRRDKWIVSIAVALMELDAKFDGFKVENICENDLFLSTVMQATQAAIRNHQKDKLEALKNAVLNAALPKAPKEDLQLAGLYHIRPQC